MLLNGWLSEVIIIFYRSEEVTVKALYITNETEHFKSGFVLMYRCHRRLAYSVAMIFVA